MFLLPLHAEPPAAYGYDDDEGDFDVANTVPKINKTAPAVKPAVVKPKTIADIFTEPLVEEKESYRIKEDDELVKQREKALEEKQQAYNFYFDKLRLILKECETIVNEAIFSPEFREEFAAYESAISNIIASDGRIYESHPHLLAFFATASDTLRKQIVQTVKELEAIKAEIALLLPKARTRHQQQKITEEDLSIPTIALNDTPLSTYERHHKEDAGELDPEGETSTKPSKKEPSTKAIHHPEADTIKKSLLRAGGLAQKLASSFLANFATKEFVAHIEKERKKIEALEAKSNYRRTYNSSWRTRFPSSSSSSYGRGNTPTTTGQSSYGRNYGGGSYYNPYSSGSYGNSGWPYGGYGDHNDTEHPAADDHKDDKTSEPAATKKDEKKDEIDRDGVNNDEEAKKFINAKNAIIAIFKRYRDGKDVKPLAQELLLVERHLKKMEDAADALGKSTLTKLNKNLFETMYKDNLSQLLSTLPHVLDDEDVVKAFKKVVSHARSLDATAVDAQAKKLEQAIVTELDKNATIQEGKAANTEIKGLEVEDKKDKVTTANKLISTAKACYPGGLPTLHLLTGGKTPTRSLDSNNTKEATDESSKPQETEEEIKAASEFDSFAHDILAPLEQCTQYVITHKPQLESEYHPEIASNAERAILESYTDATNSLTIQNITNAHTSLRSMWHRLNTHKKTEKISMLYVALFKHLYALQTFEPSAIFDSSLIEMFEPYKRIMHGLAYDANKHTQAMQSIGNELKTNEYLNATLTLKALAFNLNEHHERVLAKKDLNELSGLAAQLKSIGQKITPWFSLNHSIAEQKYTTADRAYKTEREHFDALGKKIEAARRQRATQAVADAKKIADYWRDYQIITKAELDAAIELQKIDPKTILQAPEIVPGEDDNRINTQDFAAKETLLTALVKTMLSQITPYADRALNVAHHLVNGLPHNVDALVQSMQQHLAPKKGHKKQ